MNIITNQKEVHERYAPYLTDESRSEPGNVASIAFPESTDDVVALVKKVATENGTITVSGGRTGIVGGAVPSEGSLLLSLERLTTPFRIGYDAGWFIRCGAGTLLADIRAYLHGMHYDYPDASRTAAGELFFPVNPTEMSASIGGVVANNASGARSFGFGPVRSWVKRITVVLADGTVHSLKRGELCGENGVITFLDRYRIPLADIPLPAVKNTLGYPLRADMDLIDLFIGSEGTLGIITEVDLGLIMCPQIIVGQILFLASFEQVMACVRQLRNHAVATPVAMEYFDRHALDLIREKRAADGAGSAIVALPNDIRYALYLENFCSNDDELGAVYEAYEAVAADLGISLDETWAGFDEQTLEAMRIFRHAVPEMINQRIGQRKARDSRIRKLSTDMAVPLDRFEEMYNEYVQALEAAGIAYVVFGHIGDGNVHVNALPVSGEDVEKAHFLFQQFAHQAVAYGGSVSAEHGIGRLKKKLLCIQYAEASISAMRRVKEVLDPEWIMNPGVLFIR